MADKQTWCVASARLLWKAGAVALASRSGTAALRRDQRCTCDAQTDGTIEPAEAPETIVEGLLPPVTTPASPSRWTPRGNLYVDLGSSTNACEGTIRMLESPGRILHRARDTRRNRRYDADQTDQRDWPSDASRAACATVRDRL